MNNNGDGLLLINAVPGQVRSGQYPRLVSVTEHGFDALGTVKKSSYSSRYFWSRRPLTGCVGVVYGVPSVRSSLRA
jgi:hypothetical protein